MLDEFFHNEFPCKDIDDAQKRDCSNTTTYPKGNPGCFVNKTIWEFKISGLKCGCSRTDNSCTGTLHQIIGSARANTHRNLGLPCSVVHPSSMIFIGRCYLKLNM